MDRLPPQRFFDLRLSGVDILRPRFRRQVFPPTVGQEANDVAGSAFFGKAFRHALRYPDHGPRRDTGEDAFPLQELARPQDRFARPDFDLSVEDVWVED